MRVIRSLALAFAAVLILSVCDRAVRADDTEKTERITFSRSVQLPGTVLPPGTYIFKLLSEPSEHIVRVMNADQTQLLATILAIPNYQLEPSAGTVLTTEERPGNQPEAIKAWFYPGDMIGQEFVYPKSQPAPLTAQLNPNEASLTPRAEATPEAQQESAANLPQPAPQTTAPEVPAAQSQPSTPASQAPAEPSSASSPTDTKPLPNTASPLPLIGLLGMLSIGTALTLRRAARV